ncbi:MAG: hypothetical protein QOD82_2602 [Pseudonocardiales bacterium]|nr:hypothetical protein [Pseudonocardiales bacterium]
MTTVDSGADPGADLSAAPDAWHAPASYWFWHRVPTRQEIRDQVSQLASAGFRSFQIQARLAFPLEQYLGPDYLAAYRSAADEAARHGMLMGIYDEYNWLSGHAGGRTVAGRDELRERHLFWSTSTSTSTSTAEAGAEIACELDGITPTDVEYLLDPGMNWVFDGGRVHWADWEIVAALAHPATEIVDEAALTDVTEWARFTATSPTGCRVAVSVADLPGTAAAAATALTVFVAARCATSKMINYLLPEAAERFLEVGYEPYRSALGGHFGSTVRYAFFDQPHGCFFRWRQHYGHVGSSLMYAPTLAARYAEEHAAPFRRSLLALVRDVGPSTAARRCDFFATYSELGIDSFFGTLSRWCRRHGIALSGHEVLGYVSSWDLTGTVITDDPRTNFGTDYFGLDRWRQLTAVDARNTEPQLAAKMGDSVARSNGRSGCLVEQYFGRTVAGSHFAAGRWELTLRELRAQTLRHHLLGARQLLMHAFWQTDGWADPPDREQPLANPRFDFAPGVNFEPWFRYHRAFAEESGRLATFLDGAAPDCTLAVLYPLRTSWAGGPAHPYGAHAARWTEYLARAGHGYQLIDERDLRAAAVRDGELVLADRGYRAVVLPGVEVVRDVDTVAVLEQFVAAGGTVLASGPLPSASQRCGVDPELGARARALFDAAGRCRHWPHVPTPGELEPALRPLGRGRVVVRGAAPGTTVWSRAGRTADGVTRLALFHDADREQTLSVVPASVPTTVSRFDPATGQLHDLGPAAGELRLRCGPDELVCLLLTDGERSVPGETVLCAGWTLDIGAELARPIEVDRGWEEQGWPTFSGIAEYRSRFDLPPADLAWPDWELVLARVHTGADIELNGTVIGRFGWGPFDCRVPAGLLRAAGNELSVRVASTAANRYYAGTRQQGDGLDPSGLGAAPVLRPRLAGGPLHVL